MKEGVDMGGRREESKEEVRGRSKRKGRCKKTRGVRRRELGRQGRGDGR